MFVCLSVGTPKHNYMSVGHLFIFNLSVHVDMIPYLSVCQWECISVRKPKLFNLSVLREHQPHLCLSVGTTKANLSPNEYVTPYLSVGTGEGVVIRIYF